MTEAYTGEGELINSESFTGIKNTKQKKQLSIILNKTLLALKKLIIN